MKPQKGEMIATRDGYGDALLEIGGKNKNIVALDGDLAKSTRTIKFGKKYPERFRYMGVSEADLISTAAGLALSGKIAFASSFATFITNRAHDQIRVCVAYSNANVKIVGSHGGILTGQDGPSAQAILDIGTMRAMPNMVVVVPADYYEAFKATEAIALYTGPCYLRTNRERTAVLFDESYNFEIGKGNVLEEGKDAAIFACGAIGPEALRAREILKKEGIDFGVVNLASVKPIDEKLVIKIAKNSNLLLSGEDHNIIGGLGSAVAEVLTEKYPKGLKRIGVKDCFATSGTPKELYERYELDAKGIAKKVKEGLKELG